MKGNREKAKALAAIRGFFDSKGYTEVFTSPLLRHPNLDPNIGVFRVEGKRLYLHTSPEYPMKKLLARQRHSIYQLAPVFRREVQDSHHLNTFLMLEWYRPNASYMHLMDEVEELITSMAAEEWGGGPSLLRHRLGQEIDLTPPWPRITVSQAFQRWAGVSIGEMRDRKLLQEVFNQKGLNPPLGDSWETWFNMLFVHCVEPRLREMKKPVFLYDYPVEAGLMAAPHPHDPTLVQRVELFAKELELLNGYTELTDPKEQVRRWREYTAGERTEPVSEGWEKTESRNRGEVPEPELDGELLNSLPRLGLMAGAALGVERMLMLLWNLEDIAQLSLSS